MELLRPHGLYWASEPSQRIHRQTVFRFSPESRGRNRGHVNHHFNCTQGSFALFREFCTRILKPDRLAIDVIKYTVGNLWVVHQYQEPLFILNFSRFSFFLEFRLQPETLSDIFTPMEKAKFDPVNGNDCTAEVAWTHSFWLWPKSWRHKGLVNLEKAPKIRDSPPQVVAIGAEAWCVHLKHLKSFFDSVCRVVSTEEWMALFIVDDLMASSWTTSYSTDSRETRNLDGLDFVALSYSLDGLCFSFGALLRSGFEWGSASRFGQSLFWMMSYLDDRKRRKRNTCLCHLANGTSVERLKIPSKSAKALLPRSTYSVKNKAELLLTFAWFDFTLSVELAHNW